VPSLQSRKPRSVCGRENVVSVSALDVVVSSETASPERAPPNAFGVPDTSPEPLNDLAPGSSLAPSVGSLGLGCLAPAAQSLTMLPGVLAPGRPRGARPAGLHPPG
jgi:hypothetical protein